MKTLFTIKLPPVKVRKALAGATKVVRPKKGGGYRRSSYAKQNSINPQTP